MNRTAIAQNNNIENFSPHSTAILQRKCDCGQHTKGIGECEGCKNNTKNLQTQSINSSSLGHAPAIVNEVLDRPGNSLDAATRVFFESKFGTDLGDVRIHTDATSAASAQAVNSLAYTVGHNIVFSTNHYAPDRAWGQELLAHELAHTIQQGRVSNQNSSLGTLAISNPNSSAELEADYAAKTILSAPNNYQPAISLGKTSPMLARFNCGSLNYRSCTAGVYKCGWAKSGTCGWTGRDRGCICVGARRPPTTEILKVLAIIGLSIALLVTVIAALLDPEPASKLLLVGLTAVEVVTLLLLLGYTREDIREMGLNPDIA